MTSTAFDIWIAERIDLRDWDTITKAIILSLESPFTSPARLALAMDYLERYKDEFPNFDRIDKFVIEFIESSK